MSQIINQLNITIEKISKTKNIDTEKTIWKFKAFENESGETTKSVFNSKFAETIAKNHGITAEMLTRNK